MQQHLQQRGSSLIFPGIFVSIRLAPIDNILAFLASDSEQSPPPIMGDHCAEVEPHNVASYRHQNPPFFIAVKYT